ncbi:MAG: Ig-like domain-containing protein [Treponemataceae bacterium]
MKKIRIILLTILSLGLFIGLTTCKRTVALGDTVDISRPERGDFNLPNGGATNSIRGNFTLKGEAEDDTSVKSVTIKLISRTPGVKFEKEYDAVLEKPGAYKTKWECKINNEWTGKYKDDYELIKEYPIPDAEYDVKIITTDDGGKTSDINEIIRIDNTPPVFIVDNFTDSRKDNELDNTSTTQTFGSVLNIVGGVGDASDIKSIQLIACNKDGKDGKDGKVKPSDPIKLGGTKQINNNIVQMPAGVTTVDELKNQKGEYYEFWELQGTDANDKNIITYIYLSDNAKPLGASGDESGNINEYFYLRDDLRKVMREKGYTVQTFSDYISGKKAWDDSQNSELLKKLMGDADTLEILSKKRYWNYRKPNGDKIDTSTVSSKIEGNKVVFQLAPGARPGYTVTNYAAIGEDASRASTIYEGQSVTVIAHRNKDGDKIADPSSLDELTAENIDLKLLLVEKNDNSGLGAFIKQLKDDLNKGNNISEIYRLFDRTTLTSIKDPFKFAIDGANDFSIQFDLPKEAKPGKTYALILQGKDEQKHELVAYGDGNTPEPNKFFVFTVNATGNPPHINVTKIPPTWTKDKLVMEFQVVGPANPDVTVKIENQNTPKSYDLPSTDIKLEGGIYKLGEYGKGFDLSSVGLEEGKYKVTITAKKDSLAPDNKEYEFKYDKTRPVIKIADPTEVGEDGQTPKTFDNWSPIFKLKVDEGQTNADKVSPIKSVKFKLSYDGIKFGDKEYIASRISDNNYEAIVNVTQSSFVVKFIAEDEAGNISELTTAKFNVSTDKPQIEKIEATTKEKDTFVEITDTSTIGTYIHKDVIEDFKIKVLAKKFIQVPGRNASVEDTNVKVNKIEFKVDDTLVPNATISDYNYDTKNTITGKALGIDNDKLSKPVKVTIVATSSDGKDSEAHYTFRVDSTPPEFKITAPVVDGQAMNADAKITGYAADSESGIKVASANYKYKILKVGEATPLVPETNLPWKDTNEPIEWEFTLPSEVSDSEGEFEIVISEIFDDAGNKLSDATKTFTIDTAPPKLLEAFVYHEDDQIKNYPHYTNKYQDEWHVKGKARDTNNLKSVTLTISQGGVKYYEDTKTITGEEAEFAFIDFVADGPNVKGAPKQYGNGAYDLSVVATDIAGKDSVPISRQFIFDMEDPKITEVPKPSNAADWQKTQEVKVIGGKASDNLVIEKVEYLVGDTTKPDATATGWKELHGTTVFSGTLELNEGINYVWYRVTDMAGNEVVSGGPSEIKVDTVMPTIEITEPTGEIKTNANSVKVKVKTGDTGTDASGVSEVQYADNSSFKDATQVIVSASESEIHIDTTNTTGTVTYYFRAVDNAGNYSAPIAKQISKDKTPPEVDFAIGLDGSIVNKTIKISGTASDTQGLEKVTIKAGGNQIAEFTGTDRYSWNFKLDTTQYQDNADLILEAEATDEAGNTKVTTITLKVDQNSDRPQIVVSNLEKLSGGYLTEEALRGFVIDDDGVEKMSLSQDGEKWFDVKLNGQNWDYDCTESSGGEGKKTVYFKIKDKQGGEFKSSATTDVLSQPRTYVGSIGKDKDGNDEKGSGEKLAFTLDLNPPQIQDVEFKAEASANYEKLSNGKAFGAEKITIRATIVDNNGIKAAHITLDDGDPIPMVEEKASTSDLWEYDLDLAKVKHGTAVLKITAEDNSGAKASPQTRTIIVDKEAPKAEITYPLSGTSVAGKIIVNGTIADDDTATSGVNEEGTKWMITPNGKPEPNDKNWTKMYSSTVANFSFEYNLKTLDPSLSSYEETATGSKIYKIPVYILTKDKVGNQKVEGPFTILYDSEGNTPIMKIKAPSEGDRVGGAFTVFGTGEMALAPIGLLDEVYIKFSKTEDFTDCTINNFNWNTENGGKGVKVDINAGVWNYIANENGELNPVTGDTWELYVQVYGENTTDGKKGKSEPVKIIVDSDAPAISDQRIKVKDATDDGELYISNMWISKDMEFTAKITDTSGIESIDIYYGYAEGENKEKAPVRRWSLDSLVEDSYVEELTSGAYSGYKLKLPLDFDEKNITSAAMEKNAFKVYIKVVDKSVRKSTNYAELLFRFDDKKPMVSYGEYKAHGNANFGATSVEDKALAEALIGELEDYRILIDNEEVTPTNVDGNKITFNPNVKPVNHNFVVYKAKKLLSGEDCIINGVANDDGSGVKEVKVWLESGNKQTIPKTATYTGRVDTLSRNLLGNQCTWKVELDTTELPDGNATLHFEVFDVSGNSKTGEYPVIIRNKPVAVSKLSMTTKVGGETLEASSIRRSSEESDDVKNLVVDFTTKEFAFKSKDASEMKIELTGGEGAKKYKIVKDDDTEIRKETSFTGNNISIILTSEELKTIGNTPDGGTTTIKVLIWDSPVGYTDGISGKPAATVNINTLFEALDGQAPTTVILPFFWNDEKHNSLKDNSRANGHIEIKENANSQVSGKVSLKGIAYDNINVTELTATVDGKSVSLSDITPAANADANGLSLTVIKSDVDYMGHYVEWQLDWDTQDPSYAVGMGKTVTVIANDGIQLNTEDDTKLTMIDVEQNEFTATYNSVPTEEIKRNQFMLLKKGEKQYLGRVQSFDEKTVTAKNDVALAGLDFDKVCVIGYTDNANKIMVDIVPFITSVENEAGDGLSSSVIRGSDGTYSINKGSTYMLVKGFNLANTNKVTIGGVEMPKQSSTMNEIQVKKDVDSWSSKTLKSGSLIVTVGAVDSINNDVDTNKPYNSEFVASNPSSNLWTAKRDIVFWEGKQILGSMDNQTFYYPSMVMNGDKPIFAYCNNNDGLTYRSTDDNSAAKRGGRWFARNAVLAKTSDGKYMILSNEDNFDSKKYSGSLYLNSTDVEGGAQIGHRGYNSGYYNSPTSFIELCNASYGNGDWTTPSLNRFKYPNMIVDGNSDDGQIYISYYDSKSKNIRFFAFKMTGSGKTNLTESEYSQIAQNGNLVVPNTENASSEHTAMVLVSEGIYIAYYDSNSRNLKLAYSKSPLLYNGLASTDSTKWATMEVDNENLTGQHVSMVANGTKLYIAYHDASSAGLKFAVVDTNSMQVESTELIDSYQITGYKTGITLVDDANGKKIPCISYYNNAYAGTTDCIKVAYPKDASSISKAGAKLDDSYTGDWTVMSVPSIGVPNVSIPEFNRVMIDVYGKTKKPLIAWLGETQLEYTKMIE